MQDLYISIVVTNVGENHILLRGGVSRFHFSYLAPHIYACGGGNAIAHNWSSSEGIRIHPAPYVTETEGFFVGN